MPNQTSALSPPGRVPVRYTVSLIDPFAPLFGHDTFSGRLQYCFSISNPLLLFTRRTEFMRAYCIVHELRTNGMLPSCLSVKDIERARLLYDSSFNQHTGGLISKIYRMSALAPVNALLLGGILSYYPCVPGIMITHGLYQGFSVLRSYKSCCCPISVNLGNVLLSFLAATGTSVMVSKYLNNYFRCSPPFHGRFIPLIATFAGILVGTPLLYTNYIIDGVPVYDNQNRYLGQSKKVGYNPFISTTTNRIVMVLPGMAITPFIIQNLYNRGFICRYPWAFLPVNIGLMFGFLMVSVPFSCALFQKKTTVPINKLECPLQERARKCNAKSVYTLNCM